MENNKDPKTGRFAKGNSGRAILHGAARRGVKRSPEYISWENEGGFGSGIYYDNSPVFRHPKIIFLPGQIENYPHLFIKLEWWEERAAEEMPKYLKIIIAKNESDEGHVFKVDRYEEYYVNDADIPHDSYLAFSETIIDCMPMIFCNPATEEEYNTYIN